MRRPKLYRLKVPLIVSLFIISPFFIGTFFFGFDINLTPSISGTLLRQTNLSKPLEIGRYVSVCPDADFPNLAFILNHAPKGRCAGTLPLVKRVVGLPGDNALINKEGIFINGTIIENSKPITNDHFSFKGQIATGFVVLSGDRWDSLDSRYFGPVKIEYLKGYVDIIL